MTKRLITKLLTLLILVLALLSHWPAANTAPAQTVDYCSRSGVCQNEYHQCRKSGAPDSYCFPLRQECRDEHGCPYCTVIFCP
jgi:hypothetical protein